MNKEQYLGILAEEKEIQNKSNIRLSEAMAIKIKERELSDKYLKHKWIERWDGKLPTHNLGSNTAVMLGN